MTARITKQSGLSLVEILSVLAILAVLAVLVLPRLTGASASAKKQACESHQANLEMQTRLWYRTKGTWPANDLSDLGANPSFLPAGLPVCPVDGSPYSLDPATHQILGHSH